MSQYPVITDQGVRDGVNYLLSGPSGLGQNFQGFSSYTPGYLTGNFRTPYSNTTPIPLYVSPIAISTAQVLPPYNIWQFNFATVQSAPPFSPGAPLFVSGTSDPGNYDGSYGPIGVTLCTDTYVWLRTQGFYPEVSPATGGTIFFTNIDQGFVSTDCNARVTTQGATDRVFISAQLNAIQSYTATTTASYTYTVSLNRYFGEVNNDPINPDYKFIFDKTLAQKVYSDSRFQGLTGSGTIEQETIFGTVIDSPTPGYYWYILEVSWTTVSGSVQITQFEMGLRSLSAQVVKP
jgi:hypothetical protein